MAASLPPLCQTTLAITALAKILGDPSQCDISEVSTCVLSVALDNHLSAGQQSDKQKEVQTWSVNFSTPMSVNLLNFQCHPVKLPLQTLQFALCAQFLLGSLCRSHTVEHVRQVNGVSVCPLLSADGNTLDVLHCKMNDFAVTSFASTQSECGNPASNDA